MNHWFTVFNILYRYNYFAELICSMHSMYVTMHTKVEEN